MTDKPIDIMDVPLTPDGSVDEATAIRIVMDKTGVNPWAGMFKWGFKEGAAKMRELAAAKASNKAKDPYYGIMGELACNEVASAIRALPLSDPEPSNE